MKNLPEHSSEYKAFRKINQNYRNAQGHGGVRSVMKCPDSAPAFSTHAQFSDYLYACFKASCHFDMTTKSCKPPDQFRWTVLNGDTTREACEQLNETGYWDEQGYGELTCTQAAEYLDQALGQCIDEWDSERQGDEEWTHAATERLAKCLGERMWDLTPPSSADAMTLLWSGDVAKSTAIGGAREVTTLLAMDRLPGCLVMDKMFNDREMKTRMWNTSHKFHMLVNPFIEDAYRFWDAVSPAFDTRPSAPEKVFVLLSTSIHADHLPSPVFVREDIPNIANASGAAQRFIKIVYLGDETCKKDVQSRPQWQAGIGEEEQEKIEKLEEACSGGCVAQMGKLSDALKRNPGKISNVSDALQSEDQWQFIVTAVNNDAETLISCRDATESFGVESGIVPAFPKSPTVSGPWGEPATSFFCQIVER